jgi:hypothetical protein
MADANLTVGVATEVEFEVGEKTAAWLVSLGWTPPVDTGAATPAPADVTGLGSDMVFNTRAPYTSMAEAHEAMTGRQAAKYQALQDYQAMLTELSSPERLTNLLKFFGVQIPRFTGEPDAKTDA